MRKFNAYAVGFRYLWLVLQVWARNERDPPRVRLKETNAEKGKEDGNEDR
jgi:hypothetical protein